MGKYALLVGNSQYINISDFPVLPSAVRDIEALRQILVDPNMGDFTNSDVTVLPDADETQIRRAISRLFLNRQPEDKLLFYFSGHGTLDKFRKFYLTGISTEGNDLIGTALSSDVLRDAMRQSRASQIVVILDCCYSGAFPKSMKAKGSGIDVISELEGTGWAILTASDSTQYAFEQEGFDLSLYTHFLVEGLRTGAAARNKHIGITVDDLHSYVTEKVQLANDRMTPKMSLDETGHRIVLARSPQEDPKLKFRKEIDELITSQNGKILPFTRLLISKAQQQYGVANEDAKRIEREVLLPWLEYAKNLEEYEKALIDTINHGLFPFNQPTQLEIEACEIKLGLRENDIEEVKARVIAPKQAEYDRQLEDRQKKVAEAAHLKSRQVEAELLRLQQASEAERQKQEQETLWLLEQLSKQAEDQERLKRQQEAEAERIKWQQQNKPAQGEFEFEYFKARLVKESSGFLGFGTKTKVELDRKKGKAQYIRENLGNGVTLDLVRIPAGKFMMGSKEHGDEQPIHEATLKEFWMGKYVVTDTQWQAIMGTKPSEQYYGWFQGEDQPVVGVSWEDAREFCEKASQKTGKLIRLPSETEWEYACRCGTTTPFHFGATITPYLVNYNGNYPYDDAPKGEYRERRDNVDSFTPNAWGLYQMHGNVREWCEDIWHDNYNGIPQDGSAWLSDGEQAKRLLRGGSWNDGAIGCRSAVRYGESESKGFYSFGFRVVASILS
ncbi:SUMF1/EgtB/PvdO family nonheme iron enzyme [Pseudanabaena sp. BC1403]|uniref:caspase, EACC1-associated type n=1 Tax=Pseudanabaena sp. BC1403 TaxID=2043171 RepID=UPI000CD9A6F7|nr:SUMF1/EgtB/PvdO family nonheme iron enzyme [Pseudanabaena sp. BC1403]